VAGFAGRHMGDELVLPMRIGLDRGSAAECELVDQPRSLRAAFRGAIRIRNMGERRGFVKKCLAAPGRIGSAGGQYRRRPGPG
jgi:hypothetical protein